LTPFARVSGAPFERRDCGIGGRPNSLATNTKAIHAETRGAYGWPRIWRELRHRNVRVGKERVRKMMRDNAIRARSKRKYKATADSNHGLPVSDNLLNRL
jgi:putative transposase